MQQVLTPGKLTLLSVTVVPAWPLVRVGSVGKGTFVNLESNQVAVKLPPGVIQALLTKLLNGGAEKAKHV